MSLRLSNRPSTPIALLLGLATLGSVLSFASGASAAPCDRRIAVAGGGGSDGRRAICRPESGPRSDGASVARPVVEGPVTGGSGAPFVAGTSFDLADVGYEYSEYFISGMASAYVNVGTLASDGKWSAAPAERGAYKTRILVYRPIDPADFNGTVFVEWLNVSGGLDAAPDWITGHTEIIRRGSVWVGVSAQLIGIEGGGSIPGLGPSGLKQVDPVRYGSLVHPGDSFSYDIYSQAGQAIRRPDGPDPLGGLELEHLIAIGESQSAFRLTTYVDAIDPLAEMYDGFLVHSRGGGATPLSQAPQADIPAPDVVRIRADVRVPVLTFQTETDLVGALAFYPDRQPDSPSFRLWEVAGTSHADTYTLLTGFTDQGGSTDAAKILIVSDPIPGIISCGSPINSGPQHFVLKAALFALERWVRRGVPPAHAPRIEIEDGSPPAVVRDENGNALGGIRTPYLDVPTATLSGEGQSGSGFCFLFGTTVPFDEAKLAALYPSQEAYVDAVSASTDRAVRAGFVLPADAPLIKGAAAESDIGG